MQDLLAFTKKIESSLAVEEKYIQSLQQELNRQHEERKGRLAIYEKMAGQIMDTIIRPRMEKLTSYFENSTISSPDSGSSHCNSRFEKEPRFPASVNLGFSVFHDSDISNVIIEYSLQILPIFVKYENQNSVVLSIGAADELRCEKWVEDNLMSFLDVYLQLGHIEQYQKPNLVIDPVCGVQVNKAYAIAEGPLESQVNYFCSEDCRSTFISKTNNIDRPIDSLNEVV